MNDIDTFLSKRQHAQKSEKISVLEPYKDEIFQLKMMGYAERIIVEFLSEMKGVNISRQALNQFIRSRSAKMHNIVQKQPLEAQSNLSAPQSIQNTELPKNEAENIPVRRGLRRPTPTKKFNWDEKPDPESLK